MNITYKRPRRKSMLGSRLSILRDNVELSCEDMMKPPEAPVEIKPPFESDMKPPPIKPFLESRPFYDTRSRKAREDNESLSQVLKNIETLLERNSQTLKTLMQEREQLESIERILSEKINSSNESYRSESCKENQPPNENTPTKLNRTPSKASNLSGESTPTESFPNREGQKTDDEFTAPHNPAIDIMRSSIKYLKTPRPSRQPRKSIMLTPHSFSFSIHKQFESLKE